MVVSKATWSEVKIAYISHQPAMTKLDAEPPPSVELVGRMLVSTQTWPSSAPSEAWSSSWRVAEVLSPDIHSGRPLLSVQGPAAGAFADPLSWWTLPRSWLVCRKLGVAWLAEVWIEDVALEPG